MKKELIITVLVCAIIFGGAGYYAGAHYGTSRTATGANRFAGGNFGGNRMGMRTQNGMGFVSGEVLSSDATTITIKLRDGGSRIVLLGTSTPVMKSAPGSLTDVAAGSVIMVTGRPNTDGSFKADSIQIR